MITAIKRHPIRTLLILMLFGGFLGHYEYKMPKRNFADFHVYYYTGQKIVKHQNPYDVESYRRDKVANFKYPPVVALIFAPLALLPENAAAVIWYTFNFMLLVLFFWLCALMLFEAGFPEKQKNWIYLLAIFLTTRFILYNFDEGQVNILMMATLGFGLYFLEKKKNLLSGASIAFSCLVKYMSILALPYLIVKRNVKAAAFFCVFLVALSFLPVLFLGWSYNSFLQKEFLPQVFQTSLDADSITNHQNQSLLAMLARFTTNLSFEGHINFLDIGLPALKLIFLLFAAFLYIPILIPGKRMVDAKILDPIDKSLIFLCVPLFNPNGWIHGFIFLIFPYMACLAYIFRTKARDWGVLILLFFSFTLSTWPDALFPVKLSFDADPTQIYSLMTFGTLLLYVALMKIKFSPIKTQEL